MKTKFLLAAIIMIGSNISSIAQIDFTQKNTLIDALQLADIYKKCKKDDISVESYNQLREQYYEILSTYKITITDAENNLFFKDYNLYERVEEKSAAKYIINELIPTGIGSSEPKLTWLSAKAAPNLNTYTAENISPPALSGMNWQAAIINGTSDFMAGRFKQEAFHVALDQLFKRIKTNPKDNAIFKALFYKTYDYIDKLYNSKGSSYYTADLLLIKDLLQQDMQQMPLQIATQAHVLFPGISPAQQDLLQLGTIIVQQSIKGKPLPQLINDLTRASYKNDTIAQFLKTLQLLSNALINKNSKDSGDLIWASAQEIFYNNVGDTSQLHLHFFYGLLSYQLRATIPIFNQYLESKNVQQISNSIHDLLWFTQSLNALHQELKKNNFTLTTTDSKIKFAQNLLESIQQFASTISETNILKDYFSINTTTLDATKNILNIYEAIWQKSYKKAVVETITAFAQYSPEYVKTARLLSFVSDLATIEKPEEMEKLLSAHSLPIGSSSIKRYSRLNISLNGYVGATFGAETAYGKSDKQTRSNLGLSAPIGLAFTYAKGYTTTFVSLIDLGSVVNQRFNNDTTAYTNFRFEQFFTPGFGQYLNFKKLPITLGLHFSFIPNLRNIKYEDGNAVITESNTSVTRINFSLLMDIPFFTFYNNENKMLKNK